MKIVNKICMVLSALVLCLFVAVPAAAEDAENKNLVVDDADLLTDREEKSLHEKLEEICVRQKMDIVIVTKKTLDGTAPADYADDFYDYNGYGYGENRDGLLLLISIDNRDLYISTHGYGITAFTDAGIKYIGDEIRRICRMAIMPPRLTTLQDFAMISLQRQGPEPRMIPAICQRNR